MQAYTVTYRKNRGAQASVTFVTTSEWLRYKTTQEYERLKLKVEASGLSLNPKRLKMDATEKELQASVLVKRIISPDGDKHLQTYESKVVSSVIDNNLLVVMSQVSKVHIQSIFPAPQGYLWVDAKDVKVDLSDFINMRKEDELDVEVSEYDDDDSAASGKFPSLYLPPIDEEKREAKKDVVPKIKTGLERRAEKISPERGSIEQSINIEEERELQKKELVDALVVVVAKAKPLCEPLSEQVDKHDQEERNAFEAQDLVEAEESDGVFLNMEFLAMIIDKVKHVSVRHDATVDDICWVSGLFNTTIGVAVDYDSQNTTVGTGSDISNTTVYHATIREQGKEWKQFIVGKATRRTKKEAQRAIMKHVRLLLKSRLTIAEMKLDGEAIGSYDHSSLSETEHSLLWRIAARQIRSEFVELAQHMDGRYLTDMLITKDGVGLEDVDLMCETIVSMMKSESKVNVAGLLNKICKNDKGFCFCAMENGIKLIQL